MHEVIAFPCVTFAGGGDFLASQVGCGLEFFWCFPQVARNKKCDNRGHSPEGIAGISYPASQQEFLDFIFCDNTEAVASCTSGRSVG
jgi:hypothetical protein